MTTRFPLLLVFLACSLQCATASDKVAMFSALPEGDEIQIKHIIIDCLSNTKFHEYTFQHTGSSNPVVLIARLEGELRSDNYPTNAYKGLTNNVPLGELKLKKTDVAWLDKTLEFYRLRQGRNSTVSESVIVSQRRNGQIIAKEEFYLVAIDDKGMWCLSDLPDRLKNQLNKMRAK